MTCPIGQPAQVESGRVEVTAGFFQRVGTTWQRVRTAQAMAEVVFVVACRDEVADETPSQHELLIELWRGNQFRDRQVQEVSIVAGAPYQAAYRVTWSRRHSGSSRLQCRVVMDGREVGWWELLLQRFSIDAQGRLSLDVVSHESRDTILAYQRELAALCDHRAGQR